VDKNSCHEPNIIDYLGEKNYQSYWGKETYQYKGCKNQITLCKY